MKSEKKVSDSNISLNDSTVTKNRNVKIGLILFSGVVLFYLGGRMCRLIGNALIDYKTFIKQVKS